MHLHIRLQAARPTTWPRCQLKRHSTHHKHHSSTHNTHALTQSTTGDKAHYLAKVSIKNGTVFGLFTSTPLNAWDANAGRLRHVYDTFKLM